MSKNKNSASLEVVFCELFDTEEKIKNFLSTAFEDYINDGDFQAFYNALELVIKSRYTMEGFAGKISLSKSGLYNIVKGRKEPKITTLARILKELGYSLKVA